MFLIEKSIFVLFLAKLLFPILAIITSKDIYKFNLDNINTSEHLTDSSSNLSNLSNLFIHETRIYCFGVIDNNKNIIHLSSLIENTIYHIVCIIYNYNIFFYPQQI